MKNKYFFVSVLIVGGGIIFFPDVALAKNNCYVSKEENIKKNFQYIGDRFYTQIAEAVENDCNRIILKNGIYEESLVLKKDIEIEGDSKEETIIKGAITMNENTRVSNVTVDGRGGITIPLNATAEIDEVKIINAKIGVEMMGNGKLKILDSILASNGKGFYIRKGGNVDISGCEVYKNSEEGIDIRAGVGGNITNNVIHENGESGIEVILGSSTLNIVNNNINKNDASGIAAQYYTESSDFGKVRVDKNNIAENIDYGLSCKAPSGGKGRPKGYWNQSMALSLNNVVDNKERSFASACKFDKQKIDDAISTREEREKELLALKEIEQAGTINLIKKERLLRLEGDRYFQDKKDLEEAQLKSEIRLIYQELTELSKTEAEKKEQINSRKKWLIYLLGPNYEELKLIKNNPSFYREKIRNIKDKKIQITDQNFLQEVKMEIEKANNDRQALEFFIAEQEGKEGLFAWFFQKKYLL